VAFFPVQVEGLEPDGSCSCSIVGRKIRAVSRAPGVAAGKAAFVMARPESLRLGEVGAGLCDGTVSANVYLGSSVESFVSTDYGEVLVQIDDPSGKRVAPEGSRVSIALDESRARVLPEGDD
ncbi:MAG: TOBE domain-containing protein, partial [Spirochaetaceae bacterium]|nr:TOBE domain-containing protein [Spirochaetaceae bacterium]